MIDGLKLKLSGQQNAQDGEARRAGGKKRIRQLR